MEYYTFISSMVPIGDMVGLLAMALWGAVYLLMGYVLGHGFMRGLSALWGRT